MHRALPIAVVFALTACLTLAVQTHSAAAEPAPKNSEPAGKIYELRKYTVVKGRMPAMLKRFREHTTKLFEKHGMTNLGYWTPQGADGETLLIYLLVHDSKAAAEKSWAGFRGDPEWVKVREASEADGKIVDKVESTFMNATDFSKLK